MGASTKSIKIHMSGMITSTYAVECARCDARVTEGPIALGLDQRWSASTFRYWLEKAGWKRRRLRAGDETSSVPLWVCPDCEASA
jgi:hypothetical protein